jgi:hypothetical protein
MADESETESALVCGSHCEPGQLQHSTTAYLSTIEELKGRPDVHVPREVKLLSDNMSVQLPISINTGDIVGFRKKSDEQMFYFGIVIRKEDSENFVVRVKSETDRYFTASGPSIKLHHKSLTATNLMISKAGKGFNYGGPPNFSKFKVYQWWRDPQIEGRFEVGDLLKSTNGRYQCQFLIICFFENKADSKILLAEVSMEPTKENLIKNVFHAEVVRFLREGWEVSVLTFDCHDEIRTEMTKFMSMFESGMIEEVQNKLEWCKKYKQKINKPQIDIPTETVTGKRTRDKIDSSEWVFDRSSLPTAPSTTTADVGIDKKKSRQPKLKPKTTKTTKTTSHKTAKLQQTKKKSVLTDSTKYSTTISHTSSFSRSITKQKTKAIRNVSSD